MKKLKMNSLEDEWCPIMNIPFLFSISLPGIRKYWWKCSAGHIWKATILNRQLGFQCPQCPKDSIAKLVPLEFKDWHLTHPELLIEWHPVNNGALKPAKLTDSSRILSWVCTEDHEWEATIASRVSGEESCPICTDRKALIQFLENVTPAMISEWHPIRNGRVCASNIIEKLSTKVWWLCQENHEWEATIEFRMTGQGCPVCSGEELRIGVNDLVTTNSYIAAEWHPTKNNLQVQQITTKSEIKVWWREACGREVRDTPKNRVENYSGCGLCLKRKLVSSEWHPTKNAGLTLEEIPSGSLIDVWCLCKEGHEWKTNLIDRVRKGNDTGCIICSNVAILRAEWHPIKNKKFSPEQITLETPDKFWWWCSNNHEWEESPSVRLNKRTGNIAPCPVCSGANRNWDDNNLATGNAELAAEWHPTKNGSLKPEHVGEKSSRKVWWLGKNCGHEWEAFIKNRANGYGCSVCWGYSSRIVDNLTITHPKLAAEWHPTRNGDLETEEIHAGSLVKIWWLGPCGHEWEATPNNRTRFATGCPVCSNKKVSEGFNDLSSVYPELAAEWHPTRNGGRTPDQIVATSTLKHWWSGKNCGHEWDAAPAYRAINMGCPVCSGRKIIVGVNDLASHYPKFVIEWHPTKNELRATQVSVESSKKYWWLGACGHEWEALLKSRIAGRGCQVCAKHNLIFGVNDLATINPLLAAEWHPTKNGERTATQIHSDSGEKIWWLGRCLHSWATSPAFRTRGKNCPLCEQSLDGLKGLSGLSGNAGNNFHPAMLDRTDKKDSLE